MSPRPKPARRGRAEPCRPRLNCNPSAVVAAAALADDLNVLRLRSLLALCDVELDLLPFVEAAVAATSDRAEVHEHIRATFNLDETVALVAVEPLHRALRHLDLLRSGCGARHGGRGPTPHNCLGQPLTQTRGGCSSSHTRSWNRAIIPSREPARLLSHCGPDRAVASRMRWPARQPPGLRLSRRDGSCASGAAAVRLISRYRT